jgi:Mu transposase-like protein
LREVEIAFTGEALFAEERGSLGPLPQRPFEARRVELVSVSRRSTVRIEGATYSVPSQWASLRATAYVGVEDVKLICYGQTEIYPKERKGTQKIRYRHYLTELARKPQAVRQVAPELIRELGEPYGRLWEMLMERYGAKEASRVLSRIVGAVADHGEEPVAEALSVALSNGRCDLLSLAEHLDDRREQLRSVAVPEALSGHRVESANASEYDQLLGNADGGTP